ncbi:bifunctional ADP-dependent NAD(P)H-hydrate dehydratase/NAD(P)H-hydrate epimerase [Desulfofalx alkaliphila]|uniref:bifunctional ADP-dependent NAD(P)H-hydrate dehydratase/NAD(P)H-hydrate epimerase n=1 Tax=Desulfofalx alkaliphila TaxID=105483 RepID=UPI0004E0B69C|nr:bifunctional ADP-dependent NAD(P)H-hydrate dehydratase/NAD(P)H-hydrate epimerase [Desulfofalx alkaliphila]
MRVVTAAEMRDIDRTAIEQYGIPGVVLMENAGIKVVEAVCEQLGGCVKGRVVTIFVGKGNNGGDGLVVARHLLNKGADVRVLMVADPEQLVGDAALNLNIWHKMGQKVYPVHQPNGINMVKVSLMSTDLVVDAMYGTGFRGAVSEKIGRIIDLINASGLPVIAVDIPSGLEADTGQIKGPCIRANVTVTFGLPKLGMVLEAGVAVTGEMVVADISLPKPLLAGRKMNLLQRNRVRQWIPRRRLAAHKGNFGRVLVVAGSVGMGGAALLTATACLRSGAGLVTLAMPEQLHDGIVGAAPEVMTLPLPQENGVLTAKALGALVDKLKFMDVLAVGPGLTRRDEAVDLVHQLLPHVNIPVVIDADGLNAVAKDLAVLERVAGPVVLTPHPGEMARLLGVTVDEVQQNRISLTRQCAEKWACTVLLKGARTLVATPQGEIYINPTGNPGMATAGSGDVLTGVIAALMAQGLPPAEAAAAGAYLHGMAGDYGALQLGMTGLTAGDILENLPRCIKEVEDY